MAQPRKKVSDLFGKLRAMETDVHHLTAGARENLALVIDDADRYELLQRVADALGALVLAYCAMGSHLHVVAEGPADHTTRWLESALHGYTRAFNARHGLDGRLLRGPVAAHPRVPEPFELVRLINYVHNNPCDHKHPLVERARHYPWSSRRAYIGLSLSGIANVARAFELVADPRLVRRLIGQPASLADLDPVPAPTASLDTLLQAAADVYGVPPWDVAGTSRAPRLAMARGLLVRLARLESYTLEQAGGAIGRTKSWMCKLAATPLDGEERALRIARTLIRDPETRRRLPRNRGPHAVESTKS